MSLEKLERFGASLLATRLSLLGQDPCGGSEVVLWEDAAILREAGIPVRVYGRAAANGAGVHTLPIRSRSAWTSSFEYCGAFLWKERQSVLIAYNEPMVAGWAPERAIARFDWATPLPRYWKLPGWRARFGRALYLFPSESERRLFLEQHEGIPEAATAVVPNAVDLEAFKPAEPPDSKPLRVGSAGQWTTVKGTSTLLDAWAIVKKRLPSAELRLAGGPALWKRSAPPEEVRQIAVRVERMAAEDAVQFVGEVPRSEMPGFWSSLAVAVVPSQYESFGLAALEAMACGVPVVATRVGGLPEIVEDGKSGLLVPPNDPPALAEAVAGLLTNPDLLRRLQIGARRRAERFSRDQRAKQFLALLAARLQAKP